MINRILLFTCQYDIPNIPPIFFNTKLLGYGTKNVNVGRGSGSPLDLTWISVVVESRLPSLKDLRVSSLFQISHAIVSGVCDVLNNYPLFTPSILLGIAY